MTCWGRPYDDLVALAKEVRLSSRAAKLKAFRDARDRKRRIETAKIAIDRLHEDELLLVYGENVQPRLTINP